MDKTSGARMEGSYWQKAEPRQLMPRERTQGKEKKRRKRRSSMVAMGTSRENVGSYILEMDV